MSYSKRGLKNIEGKGLSHEGQNWVMDQKNLPSGMNWVWRPFQSEPGVVVGVGLTRAIWTLLLTFVGCMLYSMVYLLVLKNELDTPSSLSAFIVAVVNAVFLIAPMMWTFDEEYRIHTQPAITVALVGTLDLGLIAALAQLVFQFGAYALGGFFVRLLAGSGTVLIDNPPSTAGLVMSWVAVTVIVFQYIYNQKFEQDGESEEDNHSRASKWTGFWLFGFTLAFYALFALRTFNAGMYLAAGIANDNTFVGSLPDINNGLYFTLVPLFASPAAAILLYWLASWLVPNNRLIVDIVPGRFYGRSPDEQESTNMEGSVQRSRMTARQRKVKLDSGGL